MKQKLALVFPGQGSQSVGMLTKLALNYAVVEQTFAQASTVLDYDVWRLSQTGPVDKLNTTEFTQPALLAAGVAVWRVWRANGGRVPAYMAGHSLGEYTALVCAGALDFTDAIALVQQRGRAMQSAVPAGQGAMAAIIGLDPALVTDLCLQATEEAMVAPANFNATKQVVIAGMQAAVERAMRLAKQQGAKRVVKLPMSVPSHCHLMRPAAAKLAPAIQALALQAPSIPIVHNVDAKTHRDPDDIKQALITQLYSPVKWLDTIQTLVSAKVDTIIECGPGQVLTGLNRQIDSTIKSSAIASELSITSPG